MPPRNDDDDWSESDEDDLPDLETSVLLGIPDGAIVKPEDIDDAAVSRLGGYPVRVHTPRCMYFCTHEMSIICYPFVCMFDVAD